MGFFDLDEFAKAAEDSEVVPHPLAEKLSLVAKTSYLGMVVFASLVDDGKLNAKERKAMRETGLALKLPESDIDDTVSSVTCLKTNPEKMAFVKESLPVLSERDTAMFLYCDMVSAMTADGALTNDAKAFLSGMAKFLKFSQKDQKFLNEYIVFFSEDKKPEAADVVYKYAAAKLPEGLISYFTPVLNPVHIPGGRLPLGDNEFCNGRFLIDSKVVLGTGAKLLVQNAEIEFGINGWIEIEDGDADFIDSKFIAREEKVEKQKDSCNYMIHSENSKLSFSGCTFDGKMIRAAIHQGNILDITDCHFDKMNGGIAPCVCCHDGFCRNCEFNNCKNCCLDSEDGKIDRCKFINCSSKGSILRASGSCYTLRMLFKKCKANVIYDQNKWNNCFDRQVICFLDCAGKKCSIESHYSCDYDSWLAAYNDKKWEYSI